VLDAGTGVSLVHDLNRSKLLIREMEILPQPLAAPVVGGMLSSLIHILVVTPVLFAWLRERKLS
jgi:hypothetical protein